MRASALKWSPFFWPTKACAPLLCNHRRCRSWTGSLGEKPGSNDNRAGALAAVEAGQIFAQRFQLVRKLGEGGMGQVWLAEQTSPVRRQVALKLIKAGMYDDAVVQRFQSERQSLAIMDHPAIAKVFDAGATPQGQPYFVMEYVPGLPITEYCDREKVARSAIGSNSSSRPAKVCSTPTRKPSSIAI